MKDIEPPGKLVHGVGLLLLIVVVLPFVVTGVPALVGAEQSYIVLSSSMADKPAPVINAGDVVLVQSVDPVAIEPGDIITYRNGNDTPTTHRVVATDRENATLMFTTKGDANEEPDPQPVPANQVTGRVAFVIPFIGRVVNFTHTRVGFLLMIGFPVGLLIFSEILSVAKSTTADRNPSDSTDAEGQPERTAENREDASEDGSHSSRSGTDPDATSTDGSGTVHIEKHHLKWATLVLAPVAIIAGVVAVRRQTTLTFTILYGSVGLALLAGYLYVRTHGEGPSGSEVTGPGEVDSDRGPARSSSVGVPKTAKTGGIRATIDAIGGDQAEPTAPDFGPADGDDPIVSGKITNEGASGPNVTVELDSLSPLVEMANERGTRVIFDADEDTYVLVGTEAVFRYDNDRSTPPDEPSGDVIGTGVDPGDATVTQSTNGDSSADGDSGEPPTERQAGNDDQ